VSKTDAQARDEEHAEGDERVFAGIDEAGLGPLLGPLAIGFSAFRTPRTCGHLWEELASVVSDDPKRDGSRIIVADSKRVHTRNNRGRRRLETTALAFLAQNRTGCLPPTTGHAILESAPATCRPDADLLARHPWYGELDLCLPRHQEAGSLELTAARLQRAMAAARVQQLTAGVRLIPAGELNASYAETGNKGRTLWNMTAGVLRHLWQTFGTEGLHAILDRQGGRSHYGGLIKRTFPTCRVQTITEGGPYCEYRVYERAGENGGPPRRMRLCFAERGEERSFAVALASCLAKYGRELSLTAFNSYFGARQPDLRPTAGYTTDGRRWLEDAAATVRDADLAEGVLIRTR
jgi:hypothetical protein